jgi:anti-sigma factor RsiW
MVMLTVFGLALLGGAFGWVLRDQLVKRDDESLRERAYLQTLLSAHRMFLRDPPAGILLPPSAFGRLAGEVDRELGVTVSLPKRDHGSLAFRGGRLLPIGRGPAALLVFELHQGRVSLIVMRDQREGEQESFNQSVQDTRISVAEDDGVELGVVGDVSPAELELLKQIVDERRSKI